MKDDMKDMELEELTNEEFDKYKVDFEREINKSCPPAPTGFRTLDRLLKGGFPPSLVVLGAVSSLGKSTLALQLAQRYSAAGTPVLYFSLEMEKYGIVEKALRRELFSECEKSGRPISPNEADKLLESAHAGKLSPDSEYGRIFKKVREKCEREFDNLHIIVRDKDEPVFTIDMIEERSEAFIRLKKRQGARPVIFVDYLQIIRPADERAKDEKQILDDNIAALWRIANNNEVTVAVISSFNRASYYEAVSMSSFKGSGNIEYTADVVLGMQYSVFRTKGSVKKNEVDEAMAQRPRKIDLKVLKYRYGESGASAVCPLLFRPDFSCFYEPDDDISEPTEKTEPAASGGTSESETETDKSGSRPRGKQAANTDGAKPAGSAESYASDDGAQLSETARALIEMTKKQEGSRKGKK